MSDAVTKPARVKRDEPETNLPAAQDTEENTALATTGDYDFGGFEGAGTENMTIDEQLTPFLAILQGLSPQINRSKPEYITGAQMGMIFNTATQAIYDGDEGVELIAVWREQQYTEWVPREDYKLPDGTVIRSGGGGNGFRGVHAPNEPEVQNAIKDAVQRFGRGARFRPIPFRNADTEEDTVLTEQYNLGVIYGAPVLDLSTARRAMIAFTSTKIGVYKSFLATATDIRYPRPGGGQPITPPLWAHRWRLVTVPQSNKKGDFYNWRFRAAEDGPTTAYMIKASNPLFQMGAEFYTQWREGQVKVDYAAGEEDVNSATQDKEEIPF